MKRALILLLLLAPSVFADPLPKAWHLAGSAPDNYLTGIDTSIKKAGDGSGFLASKPAVGAGDEGFGTVMQKFPADAWRGHRVKFQAFVKAQGVKGWAGLWMRVDGAGSPPRALAFDNMQDRPITGSSEWTPYEIVLNVPKDAKDIALGILLAGKGQVWIDDASFAVVNGEEGEGVGPGGLAFEP